MEVGQPKLTASGAKLRTVSSSAALIELEVEPEPQAREVTLSAEVGGVKAETRLAVGPPSSRVELVLSPPQPVKGRDEGAELEIRLLRADGSVDADSAPPVVVANVGVLEPPVRQSPGVFRSHFRLPATRYPEVAVLVALSAWPHPESIHGAFGSLRVPLASAIDLPGRTEPRAQMEIEIAGVRYGPVAAEADGRFRLPVVVPPGHRFGKGTAVDRVGNRRTSSIDLMLPATDQLACVMNPTRLPADGVSRARVLCALSDPYGKPVSNAKATLRPNRGSVSAARVVAEGVLEWIYTAPRGEPGADTLVAAWREAGPLSREELKVECLQGPPAKVELSSSSALVHAQSSAELKVTVLDALGRRRPGATLAPSASLGTFSEARELEPGRYALRYLPPADADFGMTEIRVRAQAPTGTTPAHLTAWVEGGKVWAAVTDLAGWPVPGQSLLADKKTFKTGPEGRALIGPASQGRIELRHAQWPGLALSLYVLPEGKWLPSTPPPQRAEASLVLEVAPPLPVNVRAEVAGREVTYWVEDSAGHVLPGRELDVTSSAAAVSAPRSRDGRQTVTVNGAGFVSISDRATGVTALVEVQR